MSRKKHRDDPRFPDCPRHVDTLDSIPPEYHIAYFEKEDGGFYFNGTIGMGVKEGMAELARITAEHEERMAKKEQELADLRAERRNAFVDRQVRFELEQAGVKPKLVAGAAALVKESYKFEVEDAQDEDDPMVVIAHTRTGLQSVAGVVAEFMLGDDAEGFRPPRSAPDEGKFMSMLADLKRAR